MTKKTFISELANRTGITNEQAATVNDIFESNFVFKKKNYEKIIAQIGEKLGFDEVKSKEIYDAGYDLIGDSIVNKIKHPFGSQDK